MVNQQNDIEIPWLFPWKNDQMVVFTVFFCVAFFRVTIGDVDNNTWEGIATKMGIEMDRIDESKLMVVKNVLSLPGDQSSLAGNSTIKMES